MGQMPRFEEELAGVNNSASREAELAPAIEHHELEPVVQELLKIERLLT